MAFTIWETNSICGAIGCMLQKHFVNFGKCKWIYICGLHT